jgi:hypothetical protein
VSNRSARKGVEIRGGSAPYSQPAAPDCNRWELFQIAFWRVRRWNIPS